MRHLIARLLKRFCEATSERQTIEWIKNNCGSGDVIHAGAYFGDFLPSLSRHCSGLVWAFEPNSENFRCAEITVKLNSLQNICLHHAALSDGLGIADFVVRFPDGSAMGGVSRLPRKNKIAPARCEAVKLTTIDSTVPMDRTVSIIHLDVEGHESLALQGAINTIQRSRPALILELVPSDPWFSENILGIGYRIVEQLNGNTLLTT